MFTSIMYCSVLQLQLQQRVKNLSTRFVAPRDEDEHTHSSSLYLQRAAAFFFFFYILFVSAPRQIAVELVYLCHSSSFCLLAALLPPTLPVYRVNTPYL